jgi:RNA polymerase sigma-70 factor (ECF subfamily)
MALDPQLLESSTPAPVDPASEDPGRARDERLLAEVARGDRRSFERLYAEFAPRVFRFAFRLSRDQTKAEEVTNDVMLEVWKCAASYQRRSSVSTWIFGIARHRTLNALRGRTLYIRGGDEIEDVRDDAPSLEATTDGGRLGERLQAALDRLSSEHREVIELTFVEGLSYREIAAIAHCPENTVKTRIFHAKKKLAPLLRRLLADGEPQ